MEALVNPYCNKKAHGAVSVSPFFSSKFLREIYQISISKRKANTLQYVFIFLLFSLFMPYIVVFGLSVQNYDFIFIRQNVFSQAERLRTRYTRFIIKETP